MNLVKDIIDTVSEPMRHICNISISQGIFPEEMKTAKVVPLFKANDIKEYGNYRPVSILPQFSKILEKIINNRITKFIKVNDILAEEQYGFRDNCSTASALLDLVETISSSLDKGKHGIGAFIDLKKAFDTVNHEILLEKIKTYGIRGKALDLLQSYLSNRKQYVVYNEKVSKYQTIKCGVPQGSILGPTLFLLYINDIKNISNLLKFIIFADDTNIYYSNEDIKVVEKTMNEELIKLVSWFKANKLTLNVEKTNFIIFSKKRIRNRMSITIENKTIKEVNETKFLGVIVDKNLSWASHIDNVYKKNI